MEVSIWHRRAYLKVALAQSSLDGLRRLMEGFTFLRKEFANPLKVQYLSTEKFVLAGWQ